MREQKFLAKIKSLTRERKVEWKRHALRRLLERGIQRVGIFGALENCEIVEATYAINLCQVFYS